MKNTIKDVAKKANVSIATVSRILNNQKGYSEKTKKKVLQVIEELGYQPNAIARGLINKRTETIGVLIPSLSSQLSSALLSGIEDVAHTKESSVIVCHTQSHGYKTMKYLQLLNEKRIDGLIFTSGIMQDEYYDYIKKMNIPVILLSTKSETHQIPYIKVDDFDAAYSATKYLIQKGHTKIGMISGTKSDPIAGIPRIQGYKKALIDFQITINEQLIVYADGFSFKDGKENVEKLFNRAHDITAIFVASDEMAIGAISKCHEMGIHVPEDISIIGYDNLPMAEMIYPTLTTVAQPLYEMGQMAAKQIFKALDSSDYSESIIMPHLIIERESVKKL